MTASMVTTPRRWFVRGVAVGILICGSLNALSYFVRSDGWGNLLGTTPEHRESIGFPCELWETGNTYGGYFVDFLGLLGNTLFAAAVGAACGWLMLRHRERLNRLVGQLDEAAAGRARNKFQFSLRGLLLATALAALVAAGARYALAGRPEVLGAIYLLGPWLLVLIAFLPMGLTWQQRVVILIPAALLLMAAAVAIGVHLKPNLEFDKVLLYIFVCWTPQSALAAIALTLILIFHHTAPRPPDSEGTRG
jgi:hypothetical protein